MYDTIVFIRSRQHAAEHSRLTASCSIANRLSAFTPASEEEEEIHYTLQPAKAYQDESVSAPEVFQGFHSINLNFHQIRFLVPENHKS